MKKRWTGRGKVDVQKVNEISVKYNISPELAAILYLRGFDYEKFINPDRTVYNTHLFKDMDKGIEIIAQAIRENKVICVVNDYDVDGDTSGTIMCEGIGVCGGKAFILTPSRRTDGYGISNRIVDMAKQKGAEVIITTDNGIAAAGSLSYAKSLGFTVVVTDHHKVPKDSEGNDIIPEADAVIDPMQSSCKYPFKQICGAEIAFKFILLLFQKFSVDRDTANRWLRRFTELAAVGTVCDVMPLIDENRALVKAGLELLRSSQIMGFRQLMKIKGIDPGKISVYNINFGIGPCMNAMSRMKDDTDTVLDFLSERDYIKAESLAKTLNEVNEERKTEQDAILEQAKQILMLEGEKPINFLFIPNANPSLLGIVAGKIKEMTGHPTVCLSGGEGGIVTGSGRSTKEYDIFEEFSKHSDLYSKFGGHSGAIGISIPEENLANVINLVNKDAEGYDFAVTTVIDLVMSMNKVSERFVMDIETLAPFGEGNPAPVLCDCTSTLTGLRRIGSSSQYIKMNFLGADGNRFDAVYFGDADFFDEYIEERLGKEKLTALYHGSAEAGLDVIYSPSFNYWNGQRAVSCTINDYRLRI